MMTPTMTKTLSIGLMILTASLWGPGCATSRPQPASTAVCPPTVPCPECAPAVVCPTGGATPEPKGETPATASGDATASMPTTVKAAAPITAKACAPDAVPPAMRLTLDAAGAAEVRAAMEAWLGGDGDLGFEPVRGIAFAKSKDDTGRDDPLPSYMARQDGLACGIHALWLRSHLHSLFRRQSAQPGVQCAHNICCYESMGEYTSTGTLILRKAQHGWQLAGYAEVAANGTLTRESVTAAYGEAKGAMETRLGERCPGEPPEGTF